MKKIILLFVTLYPLLSSGQDIQADKVRKLSIGLTFSPDYSSRSIVASDPAMQSIINQSIAGSDKPKLGYTTGLNLAYTFTKRLSLETGLLFSDKGFATQTNFRDILYPVSIALINSISTNVHYYYLDVPIKANVYLLTKKLKIYLTAGISTNIFLSQQITYKTEYTTGISTSSTTLYDYPRINLAILAGIGMNYDLSERVYLKLEPVYKHSISSTTNYSSFKTYLYSAGVNVGIYYRL